MRRLTIILEIILLFVLPVLWFFLGLGIDLIKQFIFVVFVGLVLLLAISRKMSFYEMGFRTDNFFKSIKLFLPGTIIIIIFLLVYKFIFNEKNYWWNSFFFVYYFLIGVLAQEFVYRGYLLVQLKQLFKNSILIIVVNALLFSWVHILHKDIFVMMGAFVLGAYLTWAYLKQPNIIAVSIAHGLVGTVAIILGFL